MRGEHGAVLERLDLADVTLVDPAGGRVGTASLRVEAGRVVKVMWQEGRPVSDLLVMPGLTDLHVHLREPGNDAAETVASGLAAAAHGGFTRIAAMPNTSPPTDSPAMVARLLASAARSGSPVTVLPYGTVTTGRAGTSLAPLGALATEGAVAFSDDGSPVGDPTLLRNALHYAGGLRRPIVEHPEDLALSADGEANEGLPATMLGLRGIPPAAEVAAVGRAIAVLRQVVAEAPPASRPRLHLTHLSCAASLDLVRMARAASLPLTCDITPHHLALHDGWIAGDRRYAWEAASAPYPGGPGPDDAPYDPHTRVNPPLRDPRDAMALAAGIRDGTVNAIATDHAPHRAVDKEVEFGLAANGISGLETALGQVLAAVDAGVLPLLQAVHALTVGPARVLGLEPPSFAHGAPADLVVVDRGGSWVPTERTLRSRGRNTPLLGRPLPGVVLLTLAAGRVAYDAGELR